MDISSIINQISSFISKSIPVITKFINVTLPIWIDKIVDFISGILNIIGV